VIRFPPARLSTHVAEARAPLVAVLPRHDDRALLRGALALAHGQHRRLRAWSLEAAGEGLPASLRLQLFGSTASEADRAVGHLVRASFRGQQIAVRSLALDGEGTDTPSELHGLVDSPLVVGWVRGGQRPPVAALQRVAADHPGPALLWIDDPGPAFEEVLAVDAAGDGSDGLTLLRSVADSLERCYPQWRLRAGDGRRLQAGLADCGPRTLLLLGLPDDGHLAALDRRTGAPDRLVPGPTAFVLPGPGPIRAATLAQLHRRCALVDQSSGS